MGAKRRGAKSSMKGKSFERRIACDLREVFDGKAWVEHYDSLNQAEKSVMRKTSRVKRSNQSAGAHEPDVCVKGTWLWLELQHATGTRPIAKLEQAERDIEQKGETGAWIPISITLETGARTIWACTRAKHLLRLCLSGPRPQTPVDDEPVYLPYRGLIELLKELDYRAHDDDRSEHATKAGG